MAGIGGLLVAEGKPGKVAAAGELQDRCPIAVVGGLISRGRHIAGPDDALPHPPQWAAEDGMTRNDDAACVGVEGDQVLRTGVEACRWPLADGDGTDAVARVVVRDVSARG